MPKRAPGRSLYIDLIIEATSCSPDQAQAVEESMRGEHRTLDFLTRPALMRSAKLHLEVCRAMGTLPSSGPG